jgi:cytochrome c oxidase subunit III
MADSALVAEQFDDGEQQRAAADLGIWIFLASEILFFGVIFATYTITRFHYPQAFAEASRLTNIWLGTINTALLLSSSFTMALAVRAAKLGWRKSVLGWLGLTMALGTAFLIIKGTEYYLDYGQHLVPGVNFAYGGANADQVKLFFFFYFVATGVHALHMIIGVILMAVIATMAARRAFSRNYFTPVEVGGLYWHLVDIVWIFLYPMLYLVSRS